MKKSLYFYLSFILFVLFTGCNQNPFFGVGNAADIERPSVKVTSHTNGDYVKKTFTVEGECRDNIAVSKVVVNVKGESKNYDTNLSKTSDTTWKFKIDFDADQIGSGDKTFEFTAYDTTGNTETTRLFLFIDIDMPEIIISEPVLLTYEEISAYTDTFPDRNDFKNITFFNNKTVKIAGYIEDKFIIKQTTLQIYSETDELLKTVDIKKDETLPSEASGDPLKWTFNINSNELTNTRGKFKLRMTTYDMAGNEGEVTAKTQTLNWIYIDQNMDMPRAVFSSIQDGDKITPGGIISGNCFDDDGLSAVYIKIVESSVDPGNYSNWTDATNDDGITRVVRLNSSNPPKLYTWSIPAPTKALNYLVYVMAEDSTVPVPVKPVEPISASFDVYDQEIPDITITSHKDGDFVGEYFTISGEVFDNVNVTRVEIKVDKVDTAWEVPIADTGDFDGESNKYKKTFSKSFNISEVGGYSDKLFEITAYDADGNNRTVRRKITGDRNTPSVSITSHVNGSYIKSEITLSGTCSDLRANGLEGVVTRVQIISVKTDSTADAELSEDAKSWSKGFSSLPEGENEFKIIVYDDQGNTGFASLLTITDNIKATDISVVDPVLKTGLESTVVTALNAYTHTNVNHLQYLLNDLIAFKGTVFDNYKLKSTLIKIYGPGTLTNLQKSVKLELNSENALVVTPSECQNNFSDDSSPSNWSFVLNTLTSEITRDGKTYLPNSMGDGIYKFEITTEDMAGNTHVQNCGYFRIYQIADIPQIKFDMPDKAFPGFSANGTVIDDEGVSEILYKVTTSYDTPTTWESPIDAESSRMYPWTIALPNATGNYFVHMKAKDKLGKWSNSSYKEIQLAVSDIPVISINNLVCLTDPALTATMRGNIQFTVKATAAAGQEVKKIKRRIISSTKDSGWIEEVVTGSPVTKTYSFDSIEYATGDVHYIDVQVQCISDKIVPEEEKNSDIRSRTLIIDNTPPDIATTNPSGGSIINGTVPLSGTCSDWSNVKSLYIGYYVNCDIASFTSEADFESSSVTDYNAIVQNKWFKMTNLSTTWLHNYKTLVVEPSSTGTIPGYNFWIAAVDNIGNVSKSNTIYTINQDLDRPNGMVTNPSYAGAQNPPDTSGMVLVNPNFLMLGSANDDDGVKEVKIDIHRWNGTGWDAVNPLQRKASGTENWSLTITGMTPHETNYYRVTPYITDINNRTEAGAFCYFKVANELPVIEILWPSTIDPDADVRRNNESGLDETINDPFGTIISNVKDDIYWDGLTHNDNQGGNPYDYTNHLYYEDSAKYFFGWENFSSENDPDQNGKPNVADLYQADFNENSLGLTGGSVYFNGETPADSTRSNYFRMIFKAKDSNAGGELRKIEISYNGGSSWEQAFYWSGTALVTSNADKYCKTNKKPNGSDDADGWTWFYVNLETQTLGSSQMIKIKATDNNTPQAYETVSSLMINVDNTAPDCSITSWGTNDPDNKKNLSVAYPYFGGNANDGQSGIRHTLLYFWNNEGSVDDPKYNNDPGNGSGSGNLVANVTSGSYKVSIPDNLGEIDGISGDATKFPDQDVYPDYFVKAQMYTPANWRINNVYSLINSKYSAYPIDGKKLVCVETFDNAGNKNRSFQEVTFSEFPPSIDKANTLIKWKAKESTNATVVTSSTENSSNISNSNTRIYVSNVLDMSGANADDKLGDPAPGIDRVQVHLYTDDGVDDDWNDETLRATWSVTGGTGTGSDSKSWTLTGKSLTGFEGNNYLVVEVRDITGVITTDYQKIFIDNTVPNLSVTKPEATKKVAGDFRVYGAITDDLGSGFDGGTPVKVEVLNGASVVKTDNVGITSNAWENWWLNTATYTFDTVRVTVTDKSKNISVISRSVTKDTQPPVYSTFTATGGNGDINQGSGFSNATFIGFYSKISSASEVFILKNNGSNKISFTTSIYDADGFSDADLFITGEKQFDGNAIVEITQPYTTAIHASNVGGTNELISLEDGEYEYRSLVKQDSNAIEINLKKCFIVDNQKPHIWIPDMQNTDFVGYGTSTKYGHIDVGLNSNGSTTGYDDVSGVITVYIKAQDNYLLKNIQVKMTDYAFGTTAAGAWTTILEKNAATGIWGSGNSYGTLGQVNYYKCTKLDDSTEANKDYVYLKLEFNTANVTNVAGLEKILDFRVFDMAGNESVAADSSVSSEVEAASEPTPTYSSQNANYQKWARKPIDIVPYITSISRSTQTERTKYGKFIVLEGETGLTISGYNLAKTGTNWMRLYNTAGTSYDSITGTANSTFTGFTAVSLSGVTHSGVARIAVNGIEAINNVNTNSAVNDVNKEDDGNGLTSSLWTDDRYLQVWSNPNDHYFADSLNPMHPAMEGNGTTLYASWTNTSSARTYQATLNTATAATSSTLILSTYDAPEWTDIAINGTDWRVAYLDNCYNGGSTWEGLRTRSSGGSGAGVYVEKMGDDTASAPNHADGMDEMMFQFQNPRIAINTSDSYNYVSYYDLFGKCLKYGVTSSTAAIYTSNGQGHTATNTTTVVDGLDDFDNTPTDGDDVGLWSDIQMDGTIPVIVYYDTTNKRMRVARGTVTRPAGSGQWTKYNVTSANSYSGYYVSMKIDAAHNLHIVSYKTATGDLVYNKGTWNPGSSTYTFGGEVVIDSSGNVGQWCDLELVGTDLYVSYINSPMVGTFYGIKYAYYDTAKSDWEYGVAALQNFVENKRTSIVNTGNADWKVAIGFASDYYRAAYLRSEE